VPNVKIPSVSYLGFSAETGELSDNFDIINVQTKNLYQPGPSANQRAQQEQNRQNGIGAPKSLRSSSSSGSGSGGGGSWSWFFLKIVLVLVAIGGGYVGYTFYRTSRRSSRF